MPRIPESEKAGLRQSVVADQAAALAEAAVRAPAPQWRGPKPLRHQGPLTLKRISALRHKPGRYFDSNGLYLQIPEPGTKAPRQSSGSWLLRYERDGRERWLGLGALADFTLDEARARARRARQQLADGIDPLAAREAERAAKALEAAKQLTFEAAARQYFDQHSPKWKNAKWRAQFLNTLRDYVLPKIGRLSVADIDTAAVLRVLEPIWATKFSTASRVRGRIEDVLDWATVRGYRTGGNPARWRGHLENVVPGKPISGPQKHHAAVPYAQVPAFAAELRKREGIAPRALEFLILTATRTGEVVNATWDEIDLNAKAGPFPPRE
jgi:Phage integrase central domain/Arm DNA-binding domain